MKEFHLPLQSRRVFQELGWSPRARDLGLNSRFLKQSDPIPSELSLKACKAREILKTLEVLGPAQEKVL